MVDITRSIPRIFPTDEIRVNGEEVRYNTFQGDNKIIEKTEYTLNKAPITEIESVTGQHNGSGIEFTQGEDYVLSDDNNDIVWLEDGKSPDNGTVFSVQYRADSILSRYIQSGEDELENVEDELNKIIESKFIDTASGEDLDRIGEIFGVLGERGDRSDTEYRRYLKSVVQSFISRGTKSDIKRAIIAATDIIEEDVTIPEFFEDTAYGISVKEWPNDINPKTITDVAELSDPSGVKLRFLRFIFEPVTSSLAPSDEVTSVLETPRIAHTNDGDRVQIDVNSVLTAGEDVFAEDDASGDTDFSRLRTDRVKTSALNTGTLNIDVYRDGETEAGEQDKIREKHSDSQSNDDTNVQKIEELKVASIDSGRGQVDVSFDPNTEVIGDDPESFTKTDTKKNTDESAHNTEKIDVAHYQDGGFEIDVQNILSSSLNVSTDDAGEISEKLSQQVEEVQVSSVDSGRWQVDVLFDPNTEVIGDDPDTFEEVNTKASTDDSRAAPQKVQELYVNEGRVNVDTNNA